MRGLCALAGLVAVAAASALGAQPAQACSVFHHGPCIHDYGLPLPQGLRLTIESAAAPTQPATSGEHSDDSEHKLNTIRAMFDALRACWVPPDKDEARAGMQMSVQFAFKRSGEISRRRASPTPRRACRRRCATPICMPSMQPSTAVCRCSSPMGWPAPSPASRSRSVSSTIGICRDAWTASPSDRTSDWRRAGGGGTAVDDVIPRRSKLKEAERIS
jgi:hypothetical protein